MVNEKREDTPESKSADVKAVLREDGKTDNFFGGQGRADGAGHGHAVVNSSGETEYVRDSTTDGGTGEVIQDKR